MLHYNCGKFDWPRTLRLSPSRIHREKPASPGKGKPSMFSSECNQAADSLMDSGLCEDCFAEADDRREEIIHLARQQHQREGVIEIDDDALLSEGNANGCYMTVWVWLSFVGTRFNQEKGDENES